MHMHSPNSRYTPGICMLRREDEIGRFDVAMDLQTTRCKQESQTTAQKIMRARVSADPVALVDVSGDVQQRVHHVPRKGLAPAHRKI